MLLRFRTFAVPSLLLVAACATDPSTIDDPGDPGQPGSGRPVTSKEATATGLGVSILSSNAAGAPRLIRAIVPRPVAAGMAPEAAARQHVAALSRLWVDDAQPMALVERGTQELRNGARLVNLSQQVDGVVVDRGEIHVLLHRDGTFAAASGTLLPSTIKPKFVSSPTEALARALDKLYGASRPLVAMTDRGVTDGWHTIDVAAAPTLTVESARARREIALVGGKQAEVWKVEVIGDGPVDPLADPSFPTFAAHSYTVADASGVIVRDVNLEQNDAFVYRAYAETNGIRRPLDTPLQSVAPHPTGLPDGTTPSLVPTPLVVMDSFNGPLDPWLPNNATTTDGNNAEAFADLDGNSAFSAGDIRPEVRSGRTLNFNYNHALEPLATPDQSKAATVNAFFLVNWMHDWWYDSGFTEATRNAQNDNLGRGGLANDRLLIAAQAGAVVGSRNNASMATPADGARPRMRMFLWTAGTRTALAAAVGTIRTEAFAAGPRNFDLTGDLVAMVDGTDPTSDGCTAPTASIAGKIALITFSGVCGSAVTVNNARAAGAIGVILADGAQEDPRAFAGSAAANIPGVAIGKTDGERLLSALAAGPVTVTLSSAVAGPERDGDFDNTIVAHEWGHYMHHRLADCNAQQCGGMSEGWGDFNALMMMVREGDNREGVYAMAPYAIADGVTENTAYFGLRRFPYSRDRTKNDLSFRHIGDENPLPTTAPGFPGGPNSEVHNAGEVWTTMMWEVLNVLIDQHGVDVGRRRMTDYIVAGLLLHPPDATFTEARDAILAAASALDTDDMILMAAAFAGRGAGSCAVSASNDSPTNAGIVESGTLAAKLAAGGVSLTDDGISCDHDGYLDPGESGSLRITVANNGILAAENVRITATTSNTGVRLGAPLRLNALQPFSTADLTIPVTVLQSAPRNAIVTINVHVGGDFTCDRNGVDLQLVLRTGADDVANASKVDHADTFVTPWTATGAGAASLWGSATEANGNKSFFATNASTITDTQFVSPALQVSTTEPLVVKYSHAYDLEGTAPTFFDGGVVEISLNGGATFSDVTAFGVNPGYTGALFIGSGNPIQGRQAYSGTSPGFPARSQVTLNFGTVFAGLNVVLRFRVGTDVTVAARGWDIDDVEVSGINNTPFPQLVSEPSTCTARAGSREDSTLIATHEARTASLAAFDSAVCILNDSGE